LRNTQTGDSDEDVGGRRGSTMNQRQWCGAITVQVQQFTFGGGKSRGGH